MEALEAHDVVAGPVLDIAGIFADPHYKARGNVVEVPDGELGTVRMQGVVPRFSRSTAEVRFAGGTQGQDNDAVYRRLLGLGEDELATLRGEGVV
jgi:crotonobetainyl-CoA:carnitine CoA-transferase CaiB-like acyl-CoA transferase